MHTNVHKNLGVLVAAHIKKGAPATDVPVTPDVELHNPSELQGTYVTIF